MLIGIIDTLCQQLTKLVRSALSVKLAKSTGEGTLMGSTQGRVGGQVGKLPWICIYWCLEFHCWSPWVQVNSKVLTTVVGLEWGNKELGQGIGGTGVVGH